MSIRQYSTILLDLDHTLFDSDASETAAFGRVMREAGDGETSRHASVFRRINLELWAAVERGETTPQRVRTHRFERLVDETGLDADPQVLADLYVAGLASNGELYQGTNQVLDALARHATIALITNGLSDVQRGRIERLGIARYFDAVVISAEVDTSKPGTAIFDIAFDRLGGPEKSSALMVGDSLTSDIRGGTNYGIATCWYNPLQKQAGPHDRVTHEIRKLQELLRFVGRETGA